jgi:hypothetical protein
VIGRFLRLYANAWILLPVVIFGMVIEAVIMALMGAHR